MEIKQKIERKDLNSAGYKFRISVCKGTILLKKPKEYEVLSKRIRQVAKIKEASKIFV